MVLNVGGLMYTAIFVCTIFYSYFMGEYNTKLSKYTFTKGSSNLVDKIKANKKTLYWIYLAVVVLTIFFGTIGSISQEMGEGYSFNLLSNGEVWTAILVPVLIFYLFSENFINMFGENYGFNKWIQSFANTFGLLLYNSSQKAIVKENISPSQNVDIVNLDVSNYIPSQFSEVRKIFNNLKNPSDLYSIILKKYNLARTIWYVLIAGVAVCINQALAIGVAPQRSMENIKQGEKDHVHAKNTDPEPDTRKVYTMNG